MDTNNLKQKLEAEKVRLENEMSPIGTKTNGDWEAKELNNVDEADDSEIADKFEELGINESVLATLETQLKDVNDALEKMEAGTYGTCGVCNEKIEEDRLNANPSAKTCKAHMNI
jgi:RNA polymerase-binding transcription factor DksA